MTVQVGTPLTFILSGVEYPAVFYGVSETTSIILYAVYDAGTGKVTWNRIGSTRDDTLATDGSWSPIDISVSVSATANFTE